MCSVGGLVDLRRADLTLRQITGPEELQIFGGLSYALDGEIAGDLRAGRRRPEWMWIALQAERLVARAAWWSRGERDRPLLLDVFDIDDSGEERDDAIEVGARLIETALADILPADVCPPDYVRFVPPNWRDEAAARHVVTDRVTALERVGARLLVERLRLEWRPGTRLPAASGRLVFRPVGDRAELVGLMTLVLDGTLDAHSRAALRRSPPESRRRPVRRRVRACSSPRDWWRIATRLDG